MMFKTSNINVLNENRKKILIIDNIALVFIGAVGVDSIEINKDVKVGDNVEIGQDLGSFHLGGSTIVMLSANDSIRLHQDILTYSKTGHEFKIRCGEHIGDIVKN